MLTLRRLALGAALIAVVILPAPSSCGNPASGIH